MTKYRFTDYETLLADVAMNAGEKIINSAMLFKTKHAYRESLFFLLIAQEELAKFILLPFANAAEQLDELIDPEKHRGPYFDHRVKQKIFASFGLQNRTFEQLENIKQSCLYTGRDKLGKIGRYAAKEKGVHDELCHATRLYIHLAVYNLGFAKPLQISPELKKTIAWFTNNVFIPALKDIAPTVIEDAQKYASQRSETDLKIFKSFNEGKLASSKEFHQLLTSSPFMYTDMLSYALSAEDYKEYFKEATGKSIDEMTKCLGPILEKTGTGSST